MAIPAERRRIYCAPLTFFLAMLAAVGIVSGAGCGAHRSEQHRMEGDAYLNVGKLEQAEASYEKALASNPRNAMAQIGLGRCLLASENDEQALLVFKDVMQESPDTGEAYCEAVDVLLGQGRLKEALEIAEAYGQVDRREARRLQAGVYIIAGDAAKAVEVLGSAKTENPNSSEVRAELGLAFATAGDLESAESELRAVLRDLSVDSVPAWLGLVEVYGARGESAKMVEEVERLVGHSPRDVRLKPVLACSYLEAGRGEEAEALAVGLLRDNPLDGWASYAMGRCFLERGERADADAFFQRAATILPRSLLLQRDRHLAQRAAAGDRHVRAAQEVGGDISEGRGTADGWKTLWRKAAFNELVKRRDEFLSGDVSLARESLVAAAVFAGDETVTEELVQPLPEGHPLHVYLDVLRRRDAKALFGSLEEWSDRDDEHGLIAMNALGFAMAQWGVRARALQMFASSLKQWPEEGVSLYNAARTYQLAGMHQHAAQTYQQLISKHPDNPEAYILHFLALRAGGDADGARRSAEAAYGIFPQRPEVVLNLSQAYLDAGDLQLAREVLQRALESAPEDSRLLLGLATAALHEGNPQDALRHIAGIRDESVGDRVVVVKALALLLQQEWQKARECADTADAHVPRQLLGIIAAAAALQLGEPESVATSLRTAHDSAIYAGEAGKIILAALGHDVPTLGEEDAALASAFRESPEALATFASAMALRFGDLHDEAYKRFRALDETLGEATAHLLPAVFDSLSKTVCTAEKTFEARELAGRYSSSPQAWLGLASICGAEGDTSGEEEALDKAAEVAPDNPAVRLRRGAFYERQEDYERACGEYERLLQAAPENPLAHNNLAYCILSSKGNAAKALEHAERALEALPNNVHVLHTVGLAELRAGKLESSRRHLEAALQQRPGEPALLLDHGVLLIEQGNIQEGKSSLQAAIGYADELGLEFPRRAEAEQALNALPNQTPEGSNAGVLSPA